MVTDDHICPSGLKSKDLLERQGFAVDDRPLSSRVEADAFKAEHGMNTTPQTFIDRRRIGGCDDLREHFGKSVPDDDATTYAPVIAILAMAALMALAAQWAAFGTLFSARAVGWFIAMAMCLLALQTLKDVDSFSTMFPTCDLLARRWVPYGDVYPFAEAGAGLLMLAGALIRLAAPVAPFIGTVGAVPVMKAVCIDRRALKYACVGGGSNVPLGVVSLTENLTMVAMALWMLLRSGANLHPSPEPDS